MGFRDLFSRKKAQKAALADQEAKRAELREQVKEEKSGEAGSGSAGKEEKRKAQAVPEKAPEKVATSASKRATATILAPIVSEKTAQLSDHGVMVFRVAKDANRVMVRHAFRELYKVNPVRVNIVNVRGKRVRFGRQSGKRVDYKKALIQLPKGVRIDIFEGV